MRSDLDTRCDMALDYLCQDNIIDMELPLIGDYRGEDDEQDLWDESVAYYIIAHDFLSRGIVDYKLSKSIRENVERYNASVNYEDVLVDGRYNRDVAARLANLFSENRELFIDNITSICYRIDELLLYKYSKRESLRGGKK